jgi:hypothetical protein
MKKPDNPWYYYSNGILIKKLKPCLTGNYVHIDGMHGMYRVHSTTITYFTIVKNRTEKQIPWDKFQCLKGEGTSEETLLKNKLKALITNINDNITKQSFINTLLSTELKNLRKTFA